MRSQAILVYSLDPREFISKQEKYGELSGENSSGDTHGSKETDDANSSILFCTFVVPRVLSPGQCRKNVLRGSSQEEKRPIFQGRSHGWMVVFNKKPFLE